MGIPKLWPKLGPIMERTSLKAFAGKRVAIDISIMIHTAREFAASLKYSLFPPMALPPEENRKCV